MAVSRKVERDLIRRKYLEIISDFLAGYGEDVLRVKSNEIAFPVVGCEDNEDFLVITFKVPTGANKGTEPYDAYEMAEEYERSLKEKEAKAKAKAEAKAKKMAKDAEVRAKKAEIAKKGKQVKIGSRKTSFFYIFPAVDINKFYVNRRPGLKRTYIHGAGVVHFTALKC